MNYIGTCQGQMLSNWTNTSRFNGVIAKSNLLTFFFYRKVFISFFSVEWGESLEMYWKCNKLSCQIRKVVLIWSGGMWFPNHYILNLYLNLITYNENVLMIVV